MGRRRDPDRFTRKETIERLKAAKDYLSSKERASFARGRILELPPGYDSTLDESYYCAPRLNLEQQRKLYLHTVELADLRSINATQFFVGSVSHFVSCEFDLGAPIGTTIDIAYYSWSNLEVHKLATLWLGTWHHTPLLVWIKASKPVDSTGPTVKFSPLPKYMDLIH
jgi:hypothetical protein